MDKDKKIQIKADHSLIGERADVAIYKLGYVVSRSKAQKLFQAKSVFINNKPVKGSRLIEEGDELFILKESLETTPESELSPYEFPLDIVHEDSSVIVVNKPSGLVVHPAVGHYNDTLINALIYHQIALSPGSSPLRPGLVHRIDRDTSGLLVIAKNESSHASLAKQFKNKTVSRTYWAVCFGKLKEKTGSIENYISRHTTDRKKFMVNLKNEGKWAKTNYKVLDEGPELSLIELKLETGRTHQIRVHLSSFNHPICGDEVYGGISRTKNLKNQNLKSCILTLGRFALHAKTLGFCHPKEHKVINFEVSIAENLKKLYDLAGFSKWI